MKDFPAPLKGRYQIRSELGTGGFSTIYLATDTKTGNDVSVKEFTADHMDGVGTVLRRNAFIVASQADPQPVEFSAPLSEEEKLSRGLMQIRREAQILDLFANIEGVPACIETFQENDTFYLVKEYLEGMTCREYMRRFAGRVPYTLGLYIMRGTLEILRQVHARGYIHCDVSPINSFLCRDGRVCLIDWGNAADLTGSMEDHVVRQAVNVHYAAPEQQISGHALTPATDLYCLCAAIYEAVCGDLPTQSLQRLRGKPLAPPAVHVNGLPAFLDELLTRGLELSPSARPQSAEEMIEVIDHEISFTVSPVAGTGNTSISAQLLNEKRRPLAFLTSRRARRPLIL